MGDITASTQISITDWLGDLKQYRYNPGMIKLKSLSYLEQVVNGAVDIVDPTNPFVFLLEASAINTATACVESEHNTRCLYPVLSQTEEQLYRHLSDRDFIDRFASPANTQVNFMILLNDLLGKLVDCPAENCRKAVILRDTEVTVGNATFSLQYPVVIRQFYNNILQVSYDATYISPFIKLTTNIIQYSVKTDANGTQYLFFSVDAIQAKVDTYHLPISKSTYLTQEMTFSDRFYHARVWYKGQNNKDWVEMVTTHNDQVFDPYVPTALLKVVDQSLTVYVPNTYTLTGKVSGQLRVDIYTTLGALNLNMGNYVLTSYSCKLQAINDTRDVDVYSNAMSGVSFIAYLDQIVSGGTNGMSFEELRTRTIYNSLGNIPLPITPTQLSSKGIDDNYTIVKHVDTITNRIYQACRDLPQPQKANLITPANLTIGTYINTFDELSKISEVSYNDRRLTIHSGTMFESVNGVIRIVPAAEISSLKNQLPSVLAESVNARSFLHTPFYYVLDRSKQEFSVRPYHLDQPLATSLNFVLQNPTAMLQVNTNSYVVVKTVTGYQIRVAVRSDVLYKKVLDRYVQAQIAFIPPGEKYYAYLNGVLNGVNDSDERLFTFDINTRHDIDSDNNILVTNFKMFSMDSTAIPMPLNTTFTLFYTTNSIPVGYVNSDADRLIGKFLLPDNTIVITQETMDVTLGYALDNLWSRSRAVQGPKIYQTYATDVIDVYENDVYEVDPTTNSIFFIDGEGNVTTKLLHQKGEVKLDQEGQVLYAHRAGDVVLDSSGTPVVDGNASVHYYVDMLFMDGAYYFATDAAYVAYLSEVSDTLRDWIVKDLQSWEEVLLEQTKIFFYPRKAIGTINVILEQAQTVSIESNQSFTVNLYVSPAVYKDLELRASLERTTIQILNAQLQNMKIVMSDITPMLKSAYGSNVISVTLTGLGGVANYEVVTLTTPSDRLSLAKQLVVQEDGSLIVKENVTVNFIQYGS